MASACEPSVAEKKKYKNKDGNRSIENEVSVMGQGEVTQQDEFENLIQELNDHKQKLLKLHMKLLPRERQLCMKREEVSLDISKYFSDLRHQVNQILLKKEHKMLDKLNEVVDKESQSFIEASKLCKTTLEDLDRKEDLLHSVDLDNIDTTSSTNTVTDIRKQLRDYREVVNQLDEKSEAPLELEFSAELGILDQVRQFDYGNVRCICSFPVDVVYEETDMSASESVDEVNNPELESVTDGSDPEVQQDIASDDEDTYSSSSSSTEVTSSNIDGSDENTDGQAVMGQEGSADNLQENSQTPDPQGDRNSEQVAARTTDVRFRQQPEIPDEPPPPYPGLPENFCGIPSTSYSQQYASYSYPYHSSSYGPPSRSYHSPPRPASSPRMPSAPPPPENYEYGRNRRSQEYIPPLSPTRYQNEEEERMFNMSVISRINSASVGHDKRKPGIAGICWISASFLLIVDRWNCCVKLVHQSAGTYRILSFQNFEPWSVTRVETETSAVTLPKARKLYTIHHTNGNMSIKSSIVTAKGYSSIAFCKSASLYVGAVCPMFGNPCVEILDMRGVIQSNFSYDRYRNLLFDYPRSVEVVEDNIVAVSDYKKGCVTLMRMDGELFGCYTGCRKGSKLKDPQGIAAYSEHKILFVVDSKQNAVHTITSTGEYKGVLKDRENMLDPKRACLWKDGGPLKLAVALGSGYITTFRLEELHEYV